MKRRLLLVLTWLSCIGAFGSTDSIPQKRSFLKCMTQKAEAIFNAFNDVDTNYIEPQHYNFTIMAQGTMNYEAYRLKSKSGNSVLFSPENTFRIGPFVGWQFIFYGYTFGLNHHRSKNKTEWDLSAYSSMIGIDLFYRKTGNDYKIRSLYLGEGIDTHSIRGKNFSGLNVGIKGFNIYYITNHRRFSYPAAFGQSTCQKRSAGSALVGIGYSMHTLDFDYTAFQNTIDQHLPNQPKQVVDSGLMFNQVKYSDISLSGGYAYNYVFAKNWLLAASLSVALGYKRSTGDLQKKETTERDFSFNNFNVDGIGRFGLVWNNTKWYAGASAIMHTYNYRKPQFFASNFFGNLNLYFGMNFGKKKKYKRK